ncbi:MAG: CIA30 family protein [Leptolyngbya sp. SIO4C1]|nr:CIA30 family protein [Leptolyngbya sp. SIO4C1]
MSEQTRSQWNLSRFVETLNFFEAVPVVSWLQRMFSDTTPPAPPALQNNVIFDFRQPSDSVRQLWGALDDVVMGGVSASRVQLEPEGLRFTGNVSTENSGGFASVRTRNFEPALDLSAYSGLILRVKGDGQRYKFFLRDSTAWDSVAYAYSFDTPADDWTAVQIPFAEMKPVQRARTVEDYRALEPQRIYSLQVMLSKFEYDRELNPHFSPGEFSLLLQTIEAY